MKKLQNNFTTPEQSKRLLELGMPADSADLYYCAVGNLYNYRNPTARRVDDLSLNMDVHIPCWSFGRLIEIFVICAERETLYFRKEFFDNTIENMVDDFDHSVMLEYMDFSKLEE